MPFNRRCGRQAACPLLAAGIALSLAGCASRATVAPSAAGADADRADAADAADAALIARSLRELDLYRAHLAAGLDEQQRKDEQIAALSAEIRRLQARCDALSARPAAAGPLATTNDE